MSAHMNEEDRYSADPFANPPPHPKGRKKRFSLLCKLFSHKFIDVELAPGVIEPTCKRCGKLRDVNPPKPKMKCRWCSFETNDEELFQKHKSIYHQNKTPESPYDEMTNEEFIEYEMNKRRKNQR